MIKLSFRQWKSCKDWYLPTIRTALVLIHCHSNMLTLHFVKIHCQSIFQCALQEEHNVCGLHVKSMGEMTDSSILTEMEPHEWLQVTVADYVECSKTVTFKVPFQLGCCLSRQLPVGSIIFAWAGEKLSCIIIIIYY